MADMTPQAIQCIKARVVTACQKTGRMPAKHPSKVLERRRRVREKGVYNEREKVSAWFGGLTRSI
jgi:hypothetical protein